MPKRITRIADIKSKNLDWKAIGERFGRFRTHAKLNYLEAGKSLGLGEHIIEAFENGNHNRVAVNIIWTISNTWNLSLNWLLNGIGGFNSDDPAELLPETLLIQKGAGIRRSSHRVQSEDGEYTDETLEFVTAIDKFKRLNNVVFPTWTQIYEIILALGYRKSAPARIAPLGYIIKHQKLSETQKQFNDE